MFLLYYNHKFNLRHKEVHYGNHESLAGRDESSDECVSCGACEATCDAVFEVPEKMKVKEGVDFSAYESEIKDAADSCPAGVIKYE